MRKNNVCDLLLFVLGAELAGALSALLSGGNFGEYYAALAKPPYSPPPWVFPAVWAVLYALMGFSAYLVYKSGKDGRRTALGAYAAQLAVNFLWSPVFFGLKQIKAAAAVITLLILLTAIMILLFARIRRKAALVNLPYLLWLLYAAYLNFGVLLLN